MRKSWGTVLVAALGLLGAVAILAQEPAGPPQPSPEHKKLAAFVGTWKDFAEMKPGAFGPGGKFNTTETCEWFAGGFSVVCHAETTSSMGDLKGLSVLSYDPEEKVYTYYATNSWGENESAKGTIEGDTWTWNGESKMRGKLIKSRFTMKIPSPDSATMKFEVSADGGPWALAMEGKRSRAK